MSENNIDDPISKREVSNAISQLGKELKKSIDVALDRKLDAAMLDQRERTCFRLLVEERVKEAGERLNETSAKLRRQITRWGSVAVVVISLWEVAGCPRMVELVRAQVSEHFAAEQVRRVLASYTEDKLNILIDGEMKVRFPIVESNVSSYVEKRIGEIADRESEVEKGWLRSNAQMDVVMKSASARSGSRKAYDDLLKIANATNEISSIAKIAISEIQDRYKREKYGLSFGSTLSAKDGGKATMDALEATVRHDSAEFGAAAISMMGMSKNKGCVATLIWSVENSQYLEFVYLAIRGVEKLTGQDFPPLGIDEVLSWWDKNKSEEAYHSPYSRYLECSWGTTGTPSEEKLWEKIELLYATMKSAPEMYKAANDVLPMVIFSSGNANREERRKEILSYALDYWGKRKPVDKQWYVFKTIYKMKYEPNGVVEFLNARLKEDPSFEQELRKWPFKDEFYSIPEVHWPNKRN